MMETVLNIGLGDASVEGLTRQTGNPRFAWDSYRRLVQMYGKTVLEVDGTPSRTPSTPPRWPRGHGRRRPGRRRPARPGGDVQGASSRTRPGPRSPRTLASSSAEPCSPSSARGTPTAPSSTAAASGSPPDLGTAVNVQAMAFGNRGPTSGSGGGVHPRPVDRRHRRLRRLPPGRPGRGRRGRHPQHPRPGRPRAHRPRELRPAARASWPASRATTATCATSSSPSSRGASGCSRRGWASVRPRRPSGSRTDLVDEGVITEEEALRRVTGDQLAQLMFPALRPRGRADPLLAKGMSASPGAAVGVAAFDSETAVRLAAEGGAGHPRPARDQPRRPARHGGGGGILTSRGGKTSHAAVVARGMGRTCVCGAEALEVDTNASQFTDPDGTRRARGRHHLDRRLHRRGLPGRGRGAPLPRGPLLRGAPCPSRRAARWSCARSTGS